MRRITILLSAMAGAALPSAASASEASISINSRYLDTTTFNDVFSHEPALKAEATLDLSKRTYLSGYFYTGTKRIARDDSSEYGAEIGTSWDISPSTSVTLAAGRYSDYQGRGFHAGDWYGKVELSHGRATASASVLRGASDTVLLRLSYSLPVGKRVSVVPSLVYSTAEHRARPALTVDYPLTDHLSVGGQVLATRTGPYPYARRAIVAAGNITWHF